MADTIKIGFDVGGVVSKYPALARLCSILQGHDRPGGCEVHIISDTHPKERIQQMLEMNSLYFIDRRVHSADYKQHGEMCKALLCQELGIDILIDDFSGYVGMPGMPAVRLLVMPDPTQPYYSSGWQTDGSEGDFGRHKFYAKRPPHDR